MFNLFKKENKNLSLLIEDVYNNPLSWFNDISKEQRLKTFKLISDYKSSQDYIIYNV